MFESSTDFSLYHANKSDYYASLVQQLSGLLSIERDAVTNMSQTSAFIFQSIPDLNWSGFYLTREPDTLVLGPYQGKVACVHIPFGRGVCGHVAATQTPIKIDDVHTFDGHIACDSASNAEIVVPILVDGKVWGVLDIDSPSKNRFDDADLQGFVALAETFQQASDLHWK